MSQLEFTPGNNDRAARIAYIRKAILRAEEKDNNEEVELLEAELRATEKGEKFDRNSYLLTKSSKGGKLKHHVLKDMIENRPSKPEDLWPVDGDVEYTNLPYEGTFKSLLLRSGYDNFQELINENSAGLSRSMKVLDLLGGAYFLPDLSHVKRIIGVRLKNTDEALLSYHDDAIKGGGLNENLVELINNPKRKIIEGDIFKSKTWKTIVEEDQKLGGGGYDLIVCRPGGPFWQNFEGTRNSIVQKQNEEEGTIREEIFIAILDRSMKLLSTNGGMFFVQLPELEANENIQDVFWKQYIKQKQNEGYRFTFDKGDWWGRITSDTVLITRGNIK